MEVGIGIEFPLSLLMKLNWSFKAIPISLGDGGRDRLGWRGNARGCFDLKSAYSFAREVVDVEEVESIDAGWIWKLDTLPRI